MLEKGRSVPTKPVIMRKLPSFFPILLFLVFYLHGTSGAHINNQFMPEKRMNSQGFFENSFNDGFGGFSTMKKRIPEQRYEVTHLIEYHLIWALDEMLLIIIELSSVPWAALWRSKIWSKNEQISLKSIQIFKYYILLFEKSKS